MFDMVKVMIVAEVNNAVNNKFEELKELTDKNSKQAESLEFLLRMYTGKLKKEHERNKNALDALEESIQLQKLYCYIIPKLINHTGLELDDNFDISKYEDAFKLYKMLEDEK